MASRAVGVALFSVFLAFGAGGFAFAEAPAALDARVETLLFEMKAAEAELVKPRDALRKSYVSYLDDLREKTESSGEAARTNLIVEELTSFSIGRIAPAGEFRELEKLQEIFDRQSAKLHETRRLKTIELLRRYRVLFRQTESKLRGEAKTEDAESVQGLVADLERRLSELEAQKPAGERLVRIDSRSVPRYEIRSGARQSADAGDWDAPLKKLWGMRGPAKDIVDNFVLTITGRIRASESGEYRFFAMADDSLVLEIDGDEVGSLTTAQALAPLGTITLERGWHPFVLVFSEGVGGAGFELQWSGPGFEMRPIAVRNLAGPAGSGASPRQ